MVIFEKVTAKNFFSIGNQPIEIFLNKAPTTLVTGSNGAGKSSAILDTIYFALFGKPFRNINKPNIVNSINGGDLEVSLEFTVNKRPFKIVRGIKPNKFEIYDNGKLIDQDSASRDYQKHLEQNILGGLNEKVFKQVVIIGSADYKPFMQLRAADRREVIEELLDIKIFSQMLEKAKEKLSTLKEKLRDIDFDIQLAEEKIRMQEENDIKQQQNNTDKINNLSNLIAEEKKKITSYNEKIKDLNEKKTTFVAKLSGSDLVNQSIDKLRKLITQLNTTKNSNQKTITFFDKNDMCPTCQQSISVDHKDNIIGRCDTKITEVDKALVKLQEDLSKKQAGLDNFKKIEQLLGSCNQQIFQTETDIKSSNRYISRLSSEIDELQNPKKSDNQNLKDLKNTLKSYKGVRQQTILDMEYYDVVCNMLKDGGIKTKIIKQYVPVMNTIINEYLLRFGLPIDFTLDDNFNEVIKSRHRDSFQYNNFSEGEKQRIDTALLLAWRQIARSKNTTNTNLLIMDETFDSSLDTVATEELLNILLEMDRNTNIFIISHKHDLSDKLRSHVEFEKYQNFTRIKKRPD